MICEESPSKLHYQMETSKKVNQCNITETWKVWIKLNKNGNAESNPQKISASQCRYKKERKKKKQKKVG